MKVVTTSPLGEAQDQLRQQAPDVEIVEVSQRDQQALLEAVRDADVINGSFGGGSGPLFSQMVDAAQKVRWIHTSSAGVDELISPEFFQHNIVLTCAKGDPVGTLLAEHAFALLLSLTRGVARAVRAGRWDRAGAVSELRGKTMGIVGYGATGVALARRAHAFDMDVLATSRSPRQAEPPLSAYYMVDRLNDMLGQADVVVITLPSTPETVNLFDRAAFGAMKQGAILVNVGRGTVVDEEALVEALRSGKLGGAGLDVFSREPYPDDGPLRDFDNVIITPHSAGNSPDRAGRNLAAFVANFGRFVRGEQLENVVSPEAGY